MKRIVFKRRGANRMELGFAFVAGAVFARILTDPATAEWTARFIEELAGLADERRDP